MSQQSHRESVVYSPLTAMWTVDPDSEPSGVYTTYDCSSEQGKVSTFCAMAPGATDLAEVFGVPICVEHVVVHCIELCNEETGETRNAMRTVFVSPDGRRYTTTSAMVFQGLSDLFGCLGEPPWPNGKMLIMDICQSKKKRKFFALRPYQGTIQNGQPLANAGLNVPTTDMKEQSQDSSLSKSPVPIVESPLPKKQSR